MGNEHYSPTKRKPAAPGSLPCGPGDDAARDDRIEERIDGGDRSGLPADHTEDPDRLTKSGRLNIEQVKGAIEGAGNDE